MQYYLDSPLLDKESEEDSNEKIYYAVTSMQGWRMRQENSYLSILDFDENVSLWGVFDGHGGPEIAKYASKTIPNILKNSNEYKKKNYRKALEYTFMFFDSTLKEQHIQRKLEDLKRELEVNVNSRSDRDIPGFHSGTTAVLALLVKDMLYVANIGDTRCVLAVNGSDVFQMSVDHIPLDTMERSRIQKAGGSISSSGRVNYDLNLSRVFGDHIYKVNKKFKIDEQILIARPHIAVKKLHPENGDFFVMACDGIFNSLSNKVVIDYICGHMNMPGITLSKICEQICDISLNPIFKAGREGLNNMTCMIVKFKAMKPNNNLDYEMEDDGSNAVASMLRTINLHKM